ncbi:hypothetical protein CSUI_008477 [Cystoisospora suis]|uniref:Uncharacterized protein n=1 Tax=Cystoisospora suis TaxID=483139 RepID=A0A2C6KKN7_9APIC|nr:hypothetical protein CSUI_008477 [Cystoisospora suis]
MLYPSLPSYSSSSSPPPSSSSSPLPCSCSSSCFRVDYLLQEEEKKSEGKEAKDKGEEEEAGINVKLISSPTSSSPRSVSLLQQKGDLGKLQQNNKETKKKRNDLSTLKWRRNEGDRSSFEEKTEKMKENISRNRAVLRSHAKLASPPPPPSINSLSSSCSSSRPFFSSSSLPFSSSLSSSSSLPAASSFSSSSSVSTRSLSLSFLGGKRRLLVEGSKASREGQNYSLSPLSHGSKPLHMFASSASSSWNRHFTRPSSFSLRGCFSRTKPSSASSYPSSSSLLPDSISTEKKKKTTGTQKQEQAVARRSASIHLTKTANQNTRTSSSSSLSSVSLPPVCLGSSSEEREKVKEKIPCERDKDGKVYVHSNHRQRGEGWLSSTHLERRSVDCSNERKNEKKKREEEERKTAKEEEQERRIGNHSPNSFLSAKEKEKVCREKESEKLKTKEEKNGMREIQTKKDGRNEQTKEKEEDNEKKEKKKKEEKEGETEKKKERGKEKEKEDEGYFSSFPSSSSCIRVSTESHQQKDGDEALAMDVSSSSSFSFELPPEDRSFLGNYEDLELKRGQEREEEKKSNKAKIRGMQRKEGKTLEMRNEKKEEEGEKKKEAIVVLVPVDEDLSEREKKTKNEEKKKKVEKKVLEQEDNEDRKRTKIAEEKKISEEENSKKEETKKKKKKGCQHKWNFEQETSLLSSSLPLCPSLASLSKGQKATSEENLYQTRSSLLLSLLPCEDSPAVEKIWTHLNGADNMTLSSLRPSTRSSSDSSVLLTSSPSSFSSFSFSPRLLCEKIQYLERRLEGVSKELEEVKKERDTLLFFVHKFIKNSPSPWGISKKSSPFSSLCLDVPDGEDEEEEKAVSTTCECPRNRESLLPSFFNERENAVIFSLSNSPKKEKEENKRRERKVPFSHHDNEEEEDSLKGSYHACR